MAKKKKLAEMTKAELYEHEQELAYKRAKCPLCYQHMSKCVCLAAEAAGIAIPKIKPVSVNGRFLSTKEVNTFRYRLMFHGFLSPRKIVARRPY